MHGVQWVVPCGRRVVRFVGTNSSRIEKTSRTETS